MNVERNWKRKDHASLALVLVPRFMANDPVIGAAQFIVETLGKSASITLRLDGVSVGKTVGLTPSDITRRAPEICCRIREMGHDAEFVQGVFTVSRPVLEHCVRECMEEHSTKGQWTEFLEAKGGLSNQDKAIVNAEVRKRLGKPLKPWSSSE